MLVYGMASDRVRKLAREHPDQFREVAEARDDELCEHLLSVLSEEQQVDEKRKQPVTA